MSLDRIHIFGASGAGTSTLGRALAAQIGSVHFDTDDIYWAPTDPPYTQARSVEERHRRLLKIVETNHRWILAGSLCGWGNIIVPHAQLAIFVETPTPVRLQRLGERERTRFGDRIAPGGDMYDNHTAFVEWASQYDSGNPDMRSRAMHEAWVAKLKCPVKRVDGTRSIDELVELLHSTT